MEAVGRNGSWRASGAVRARSPPSTAGIERVGSGRVAARVNAGRRAFRAGRPAFTAHFEVNAGRAAKFRCRPALTGAPANPSQPGAASPKCAVDVSVRTRPARPDPPLTAPLT